MNINKDAERIIVEVVQRLMDRWATTPEAVEEAIFDVIYQERRRLETDPMGTTEQANFYDMIQTQALHASPQQQRELLRLIIERFAREIQGHFNPVVYKVATSLVPTGLNAMLNTLSPIRLVQGMLGDAESLANQARLRGETTLLQKLAKMGTIVLVPTHSSNLDSVLVGFSLYKLGLPPFSYGAGLNLFANKLFGFFMHNLGAYKVDRRKKAELYKDALKTYAGVTMELGYHNLFFPGGTRSRSGAVERKLKKGLLGAAMDAYIHNLTAGKKNPDIFVVPCTINYQLVLEAATLIDDYLKAEGKSRYIIEDDEFSRPKLVLDFVRKLFRLQSKVDIVFGRPMDLFGNPVDESGQSLDRYGRPIDRTRYVLINGRPGFDLQRDREYTNELAEAVVRQYMENTVIKPVNLVSHVVMQRLRRANPQMGLYRLLRTGGRQESFSLKEVYQELQSVMEALMEEASQGKVVLDEAIRGMDPVMVMGEALAHMEVFHTRPALMRRGDRLFHHDRNLLLYYGNRLGMHSIMDGQGNV